MRDLRLKDFDKLDRSVWEKEFLEPEDAPFDYTPTDEVDLNAMAHEICRLTGIDGNEVLKVLICEAEILVRFNVKEVFFDKMAAATSYLTGVDSGKAYTILEVEDDIMFELGLWVDDEEDVCWEEVCCEEVC